MTLDTLRPGNAAVIRTIDQYGRYGFIKTTIQRIHGGVAYVTNWTQGFNRKTGQENGYHVSKELRKPQLFSATDATIVEQLAAFEAGTLAPAFPPERVKLLRAWERTKYLPIEAIEAAGLGEAIIKAFGQPDDYKA